MSQELESAALHEFTKVLHNSYTKKAYMAHLRKYQAWSKLSYDELINRDNDTIQAELEKYLEYLQEVEKHTKPYLKLGFSGIILFYSMNNRIINKVRIAKMMWPEDHTNYLEAYTTEDIRKILDSIGINKLKKHPRFSLTRLRLKAMIHFLAASGCRVGVLSSAKVKDLTKIEDCYCIKVYSNHKDEYLTFLTPEASEVLDEWLTYYQKNFKTNLENDPFSNWPLFDLSYESLYMTIHRLIKKADLGYEKNGKRFPKPTNHAHRYRFNTIAKSNKDVNPILIERLLGHKTSIALDAHYLKPSMQDLFAEYKKLIKDLTIY